jgi:hypothetical protein
MDTADYHRVIAALSREADTAHHQAALLRQHPIGDGWVGRVRVEAELSLASCIDSIDRAEEALETALADVARVWRESLSAQSFLG